MKALEFHLMMSCIVCRESERGEDERNMRNEMKREEDDEMNKKSVKSIELQTTATIKNTNYTNKQASLAATTWIW